MNFSKLPSIIKLILLKIIEEIERRINAKRGVDGDEATFASSVYTSLKFIVLDQVDVIVDDAVGYAKKQINGLATLIAQKTSVILASLFYMLIVLGLVFTAFVFFAIALALYLGDLLGNHYWGFLILGVVTVLLLIITYARGHKNISERIKNHLLKML